MRAYGRPRCYCVEKRVRRPFRGGKGCCCCGASGDARKKRSHHARARREVDEDEYISLADLRRQMLALPGVWEASWSHIEDMAYAAAVIAKLESE